MGSGLDQGSVFHLQGNLIDHDTLASRADLLGTTRPSVLLYAGIDGWRRQMAVCGHSLMSHALRLAASGRQEIETIDGMHVNDRADFCGPGAAAEFDPLPVVIDIRELGTSGYLAADWLRDRHRIDTHLMVRPRLVALAGITAVSSVFGRNYQLTLAVLVFGPLHADQISTVLAVGGIVGAVLARRLRNPTARIVGVLGVCGVPPNGGGTFSLLSCSPRWSYPRPSWSPSPTQPGRP